jgi:hypothetical protein
MSEEIVYSNVQSKFIYCFGCDIDTDPENYSCTNNGFICFSPTCAECGYGETKEECETLNPFCV